MNPSKSILIVEDEPIIAEDIASTLRTTGYEITGMVDNAEEAMRTVSIEAPDLVLLDVKIKGATDGIALARQIRLKHHLPFIFLTSYYDAKTLDRAKATEPQGYLVKPFDEKDLIINIEMALYKTRNIRQELNPDKFFVKKNNEMVALNVPEILFIEAFDNYAKVVTATEKHIVSHTLKSVEEKLTGRGFVRIHRSFLVNFQKISSISEGYIYIDLHKLPLGHSYREELLTHITLL